MPSSLPFLPCGFLPFCFFFWWNFTERVPTKLFHTFLTLDGGFQPGQRRNQIVLSSVKHQNRRMFLGHGNALEESWDFTSGPQGDTCSVVPSEVIIIFKFVCFEAKRCCVSTPDFPDITCQSSNVCSNVTICFDFVWFVCLMVASTAYQTLLYCIYA